MNLTEEEDAVRWRDKVQQHSCPSRQSCRSASDLLADADADALRIRRFESVIRLRVLCSEISQDGLTSRKNKTLEGKFRTKRLYSVEV